jgi:hypothetical protein
VFTSRGIPVAVETPKLKVFISWAGDRANAIGTGFHEFLPDVVNAVQPFMSGRNIDKGTRWSEVLNSSLQESSCAIVCLTRESMQSIWVAFEAGAISKAAGGTDGARSRIWTYLSGLETKDLQLTPFAEYQATNANEEETFRVVESINRLSPDPVSAASLKRRFDAVFWPNFSKVLTQVREISDTSPVAAPATSSSADSEILSEILKTLRSVQREVATFAEMPLPRPRRSRVELSAVNKRLLDEDVAVDTLHWNTSSGTIRLEVNGDTVEIPVEEVDRILKDEPAFKAWANSLRRVTRAPDELLPRSP